MIYFQKYLDFKKVRNIQSKNDFFGLSYLTTPQIFAGLSILFECLN